jgi:hypothetical protein
MPSCEAGVIRNGLEEPCGKPAVGSRRDWDDEKPWPACREHLHATEA